jgi:hypothetical protein
MMKEIEEVMREKENKIRWMRKIRKKQKAR